MSRDAHFPGSPTIRIDGEDVEPRVEPRVEPCVEPPGEQRPEGGLDELL
jgi:hypothetical protein